MWWHEQHGLRAKRRSSVSRFTISRSFSLLSLLPPVIPTGWSLALFSNRLSFCPSSRVAVFWIPPPHPTLHPAPRWTSSGLFFIYDQFMAQGNKHVNCKTSVTKWGRALQLRSKVAGCISCCCGYFCLFFFWVCQAKLVAQDKPPLSLGTTCISWQIRLNLKLSAQNILWKIHIDMWKLLQREVSRTTGLSEMTLGHEGPVQTCPGSGLVTWAVHMS